MLLCRHMNGRFPYPFLNAMPFPSGFIAIVVAGLAIFWAMFRAGKLLARRVERVEQLSVEWVSDQMALGDVAMLHAEQAVSKGKLV
jgi:hypothetical protein